MKKWMAYVAWFCMYVLCVGLGTVDDPQGMGKVLFVLTGLIFFLPPGWLLYTARKTGDKKQIVILRVISIVSLSLTLLLLVGNFLSVRLDAALGNALYEVLNLVSAPMLCCQYWVLSLFLWAALLNATFMKGKK